MNIGAGTITCNYDGVNKHKTDHRGRRVHRLRHAARRAGAHRRRRVRRRGHRRSPKDVPADALALRPGAADVKPAGAAERQSVQRTPRPPPSRWREGAPEGLTPDYVRHRRLRRVDATRCPSSSRGCGGSSTAATTRPASRSCGDGAPAVAPAPPASSRNLEDEPARGAARGHDRHRPHALGDPRPARARRTPTRTRLRARSSWSTTASSRTTWRCKQRLRRRGPHASSSETDTEIIAHLVDERAAAGRDLGGRGAPRARARCEGAYALVVLIGRRARTAGRRAKNASPLVVGLGEGENFVASDVPALLAHTRDVLFLEDGDVAELTPRTASTITDLDGRAGRARPQRITWDPVQAEKGGYKHFMLKEIHEQPRAVPTRCAAGSTSRSGDVAPRRAGARRRARSTAERVVLIACGTS